MPTYKELEIMTFEEAGKLNRVSVGGNAFLTGHHIIPDHCFYVCKGGRSAQGVQSMQMMGTASYHTDNAPVILLTADANGGKTLHHGDVHDNFDPIEKANSGFTWTYEELRDIAIKSILDVFSGSITESQIKSKLDDYYIDTIGLKMETPLRCGEHTSLADSEYAPIKRTSTRAKRKPKPY